MSLAPATPGPADPAGTDEHGTDQHGGGQAPTLLILGAGGDLTTRLLLPGLAGLLAHGGGAGLTLVGCGTDDWTDGQWRERVTAAFAGDADGQSAGHPHVAVPQGRRHRPRRPDPAARDCGGIPALYFALPPAVTARACQALARHRPARGHPAGAREAVRHRPRVGRGAQRAAARSMVPGEARSSASTTSSACRRCSTSSACGSPTACSSRCWNASTSSSVEIVYDEDARPRGPGRLLRPAGALVDMVQSHLLQVMALLDDGAAGHADARRPPRRRRRRCCARPGLGRRPGRRHPPGPLHRRHRSRPRRCRPTPTSRASPPSREHRDPRRGRVQVDTWRWAGRAVPAALRQGAGPGPQGGRRHFAPPPHVPDGLHRPDRPDRLRIGLSPDRCRSDLNLNGRATRSRSTRSTLRADFGAGDLLAYGEVLDGHPRRRPDALGPRRHAEECWRIVQPVLDAWRADRVPLHTYPAGSDGPDGWNSPPGSSRTFITAAR